MDANRRLLQRDKGFNSSGSLGPGWSYYVEPRSFERELKRVEASQQHAQSEVSRISIYIFVIYLIATVDDVRLYFCSNRKSKLEGCEGLCRDRCRRLYRFETRISSSKCHRRSTKRRKVSVWLKYLLITSNASIADTSTLITSFSAPCTTIYPK
jgi:hypothetical protein